MTNYTQSIVVSANPSDGPSRSASIADRAPSPVPDRTAPPRRVPIVRARYDAAQTTPENIRHWSAADGLSARAANDPQVRKKLRDRARYEVANNSYAKGIVETLANDVVGTGPRLQLLTEDLDLNRRVSDAFEAWTAGVGLAEKLRTIKKARTVDGEAFVLLTTNPRLPTEVQLDLRLIEADQVASPYLGLADPLDVDGIRFDRFGNPVSYHILKDHPGDTLQFSPDRFERFPAQLVLHWFRADRPGQVRGVPDITPALQLFGQLRRYTLAVIAAAETAADFAAVLYSDAPPDGGSLEGEPFETLEIERRLMTTLPAGWKMGQFKAEQPTTSYPEFKAEIINEIARCLNMPFNVAAGNSAGYNYSSGRLDHQTYFKSIGVDQYHLETAVLDRLFFAWLEEAYLARLVDQPPDRLEGWPHQWFWDGFEHVDPSKEANAEAVRLANNTITLADVWARRGFDWREKLQQRAAERKFMAELGLGEGAALPAPARRAPADADAGDETDEQDDDE